VSSVEFALNDLDNFKLFIMEDQFVPKPNSNMILAIFSTICCCLPVGIYAIIKASSVDGLYASKQYAAAQAAADEAKKWSMIAIILGVIGSVISFAINGLSLLAL